MFAVNLFNVRCKPLSECQNKHLLSIKIDIYNYRHFCKKNR